MPAAWVFRLGLHRHQNAVLEELPQALGADDRAVTLAEFLDDHVCRRLHLSPYRINVETISALGIIWFTYHAVHVMIIHHPRCTNNGGLYTSVTHRKI